MYQKTVNCSKSSGLAAAGRRFHVNLETMLLWSKLYLKSLLWSAMKISTRSTASLNDFLALWKLFYSKTILNMLEICRMLKELIFLHNTKLEDTCTDWWYLFRTIFICMNNLTGNTSGILRGSDCPVNDVDEARTKRSRTQQETSARYDVHTVLQSWAYNLLLDVFTQTYIYQCVTDLRPESVPSTGLHPAHTRISKSTIQMSILASSCMPR